MAQIQKKTKKPNSKEIELQLAITSLKGELSEIFTNCLKIAVKENYPAIIEYLNPNPEEILAIKEQIKNGE